VSREQRQAWADVVESAVSGALRGESSEVLGEDGDRLLLITAEPPCKHAQDNWGAGQSLAQHVRVGDAADDPGEVWRR
jgi:hypothetical protein